MSLTQSERPLVSVIVPVFQVEAYLPECLASISAQTYTNIEILLVNDGSHDRSGKICDEFAAANDRAVVIDQENQGVSSARNAGIAAATGVYLCFVDSDDVVDPRYVELLLTAALVLDADIAVCGFSRIPDAESNGSATVPESRSIMSAREATRLLLGSDQLLMTVVWNKLFASTLFTDLSFRGRIHEDDDLAYRILEKSQRVATVPHALYGYRDRPGSLTDSPWQEQGVLRSLEICRARIGHYAALGDEELGSAAHRKYLEALLLVNAKLSRTPVERRTYWARHIREEILRLTTTPPPLRRGRVTTVLTAMYKVSSRAAVMMHRLFYRFEESPNGKVLLQRIPRRQVRRSVW